jgi:hypothetical protein
MTRKNPADATEDIEVLAVGAPAVRGDAHEYDPSGDESEFGSGGS